MNKTIVGSEITHGTRKESEFTLLGIDLQEKKYGLPVWGWGAILGYIGYRLLKKKR